MYSLLDETEVALKVVTRNNDQKILKPHSITEENFKIGWGLLTERYFGKREIYVPKVVIQKHIALLSQYYRRKRKKRRAKEKYYLKFSYV